MTRLEKALAALHAAVAEPIPEVKPVAKVVERVVEVQPNDPNWSLATAGKVKVDIYEQLYWSAVDRAFNPAPFAEVVSAYDPFARHRMPGYDHVEDR